MQRPSVVASKYHQRQLLKTTLPHLLFCFVVVVYLVIGGFAFVYLENNVAFSLNGTTDDTYPSLSAVHKNEPKNLSVPMSMLLSFTILTTIGYGEVVPHSSGGKIFCILYGLVGIPLMLLAIANLGRFLSAAVNGFYSKLLKRLFRKSSEAGGGRDDYPDRSLPPVLLLGLFAVYTCFGAVIVKTWDERYSFLDGVYFSFISLTSIGFGDIVPPEDHLLVALLYVGFGLTLSTMAVDILAEYLRRLHYFGKVVKNSARATIWFGGKLITVKDLIQAVGKYLGAPDDAVDELCANLDRVVSDAIAERKLTNAGLRRVSFPREETEEFRGSVKPIYLEAARDDKITFIDENGHTHKESILDGSVPSLKNSEKL